MKIQYFYLLFIFFNCNLLDLRAQDELSPGYIITSKSETIHGWLADESDRKLSKRVYFYSENSNTSGAKYMPGEIQGFGYETGRIFKALNSSIDSSMVFGKQLAMGKMNMFICRYQKKSNFQIHIERRDINKSMVMVPIEDKFIEIDDMQYVRKDKRFVGQLVLMTNDYMFLDEKDKKKIRCTPKDIQKFVSKYNAYFENQYASQIYKEKIDFTYDVLAGYPLPYPNNIHFRLSFYRNKTFSDIRRNLSWRMGLSYVLWNRDYDENKSTSSSFYDYREQVLSIIPIGVYFQSNAKTIVPYAYFGVGIGFLMFSDYDLAGGEIIGTKNEFGLFPTVNLGLGARIKINSNYLLFELTPNYKTIFFNVGYSF